MPANTIAVVDLAKLLDITPRQVQNLTQDGILNRARDEEGNEIRGRYTLLCIRDYCRYLRGLARLDDASESTKTALHNRRAAAEAEMAELRLQQFKGKLHDAGDVEFCMTNMLTFFKQRVLAIPSRIARLLVGKKNFHEIYDVIMTEIVAALKELSGYDPSMFAAQTAARLAAQGVDLRTLNGQDNPQAEAADSSESDALAE